MFGPAVDVFKRTCKFTILGFVTLDICFLLQKTLNLKMEVLIYTELVVKRLRCLVYKSIPFLLCQNLMGI